MKKLEDGGELHDIRLAANDVHGNLRSRQKVSPDSGLALLQAVTSVCILYMLVPPSPIVGLLDSFPLYLLPSHILESQGGSLEVCFSIPLYKYRYSIF